VNIDKENITKDEINNDFEISATADANNDTANSAIDENDND
jgi:hypothetical protein